jgi:glycosyltransferase involved in cell wall biosynthesis
MEITVLFPAYNEEENIRSAISKALEALRPRFERFEILIIDDGSRDRTGQIADELAREHREIRVIHNERNLGLGPTLYKGYRSASCELVIQNAMDYPLDLKDLDKMLPLLDEADVVIAVRKTHAGYTPYRKLTSRVNRAMLRFLFKPRLRDYNYTQLFKKKVLDSVEPTTRNTVFLAPEVIIRAYAMGFRIKEVDIDYHPRIAGEATSGKPSIVVRAIYDTLKFWLMYHLNPKRRSSTT